MLDVVRNAKNKQMQAARESRKDRFQIEPKKGNVGVSELVVGVFTLRFVFGVRVLEISLWFPRRFVVRERFPQ